MENLLLQIVKDASSSKYVEIRNTCQQLHDFLEAQQGSLRAPPHELRERCMNVLKLALESHNAKLVAHSITGFQKLLRDDRFQSNLECELEEQWLPSQILLVVGAIKNHSEEVQVDLLKILLNMACTTWWSMNEGVILRILRICQEAFVNSSQATKIAAQATASQILWAFCNHLQEEEKISQKNPYLQSSQNSEKEGNDSPFSSIVPILQYLCRKLQQKPRNNNLKERVIPLYLESLLSLVSSLPGSALKSYLIQDYLWKEFCPTLLALLGSPKADKNAFAQKSNSENHVESIRSSNVFTASPVLTSTEAKTVYNIAIELVRLAGPFISLRPMLESMFHRILLHTSPSHRLEALKATKEILKKPDRLLNFGGPPLFEDKKASCSTDLGLLKLAIDAFVECAHCSDTSVCYQSVDCVVHLLDSLEQICAGKGISPQQVNLINNLYQSLESSDYTGPMTYQSWEKLKRLAEIQQEFVHSQSETEEDTDTTEGSTTKENEQNFADGDDDDNDDDGGDSDMQEPSNFSSVIKDPSDNKKSKGDQAAATSDANGNHVPNLEDLNGDVIDPSTGQSSNIEDRDTPSGYETDSSGSTEGPEEGFDDQAEADDHDDEVNDTGTEDQAARRQRVPKTLLGSLNAETEADRVAKLYETRDLYAQQERNNARHFTGVLKNLLPKVLIIKSSIEADEALQQFASQYCEEVLSCQISTSNSDCMLHHMIVNADGVYLATYSALLLNLKLIQSNYYDDDFLKDPHLTEDEFIDNVHGSGVLVYLSATWLAELYQQILICDFLTHAGYSRTSHENSALINLLTDLEGLNSGQSGAYLLSDYFRLERAVSNAVPLPEVEAGQKFSRRVLTGCWDGILEVLSVLLNGKNAIGISGTLGLMLGIEGAKEEHRRARDAVANCLNGLQKAARLSNVLNVHSRCEAVFALLATVSCPATDSMTLSTQRRNKKMKSSVLYGKNHPLKLHASHVLSMDVILSRGLELGSHSPDCWKHIFRCCMYLADLEHSHFSTGSLSSASTTKIQPHKETDVSSKPRTDDFSDEGLSFSAVSLKPLGSVNIPDLVKLNVTDLGTGILSPEQSLQVMCALLLQADRLFDDAAYKLNLKSLLGFLNALCFASQSCLFSSTIKRLNVNCNKGETNCQTNLSLLHRIGDVMLKCVRSGRPLMHVMQAWSVVGLHLMEAACHKDPLVAKRAVTSIHDIVNALLANQSELPYFHFNEALFKPFENLLCLELCDSDIQDQIISSICEFVEGCTTEIRSGWRPLFGALRAVRPTSKELVHDGDAGDARLSPNHIRAVLDVFEAFLNTNNVLVFANAAVDCILCLLKHIKGESNEDDVSRSPSNQRPSQSDLCLASLKYIHTCCSILASMQEMAACPIFHASNRIQLSSSSQNFDPEIPGMTFVRFLDKANLPCKNDESVNVTSEDAKRGLKLSDIFTREAFQENLLALDQLEHPSGILHIWCLILEGLVGAVVAAPPKYQSCIMETLFDLLKNIYELPGVEFGLYVINNLLLPMMQMWLRRTIRIYRGWDNFASQFKQCCGQATDLVVDYMTKLAERNHLDSVCGVKLMLYQLLQLMIECITQPTESISRLGCSCIRHVIVTCGPILTSDMWEIICRALCSACDASLFSVKQLMEAFHANSDNFYGDIGQVKVAAKPDCSPEENERLKQLAQQVFLLDNQCSVSSGLYLDDPIDDDRSYIFLLYPPNAEHSLNPDIFVVKVPFRSLVVGLLSHQILLQIIGAILLQGLPHVVPSLANILLQSPAPTSSSARKSSPGSDVKSGDKCPPKCVLPDMGMIQYLSHKQLFTLLDCLEDSYETACKFDARPGLKFLVQKVARANAAANLYKQMGASWTIRSVVLLELCLHYQQWKMTNVQDTKQPVDLVTQDENTNYYVSKLKSNLSDICALYAELFVKKEDDCFDRLQDQPIFFLVAQTDDYMEMRHKNDEEMCTPVGKLLLKDKISPASEEQVIDENQKFEVNDESPEFAQDALDELGSEGDDEDDTQVYSVATQKDIDSVVNEFKRRKQQHAMPAGKRDKRKSTDQSQQHRAESHDTKLPSVLKDHEAHIKVRTEMLLSAFDFFCQLDDKLFKILLPSVFPFVRTLVAHGNDSTLRQTLAEFLDRVAGLYSFGAEC